MSRLRWNVVLFALLGGIAGAEVAAAQETRSVALLGGLPWREARAIVEAHGGRIVHVLPPDVLIGEIPEGAGLALQEAAQTARDQGLAAAPGAAFQIVRTRGEAEALLGAGPVGVAQAPAAPLSAEIQAALRLLAPVAVPVEQDPLYQVMPDGTVRVRSIEEWEEPPLVPDQVAGIEQIGAEATGAAIGNTFYNTSDFMAGDVGVAILRPESTGVTDPSSEDWTAGEVSGSLTQILAALDKLSNDSRNGKLTFVYRTESFGPGVAGTVSCDYEAILYSNWTSNVVLNFLGKLGYASANSYDRLHDWVNDVRTDLGTDWAFGIIVVDNSTDTTRGRASAYLTGPAGWLFQQYTASVYHHEMGHIWSAIDEYHPDAGQSPTALHGYQQVVNANSQCCDPADPDPLLAAKATGYFSGRGESISALMINNIDYVSPWARGQWGIWDLDGDGIYDTQDTFPTVTLNAPSGTTSLTFTGNASATALIRETGTFATANITINKITRVEWRLNLGPWQDASASDGSFNSSSEGYTFTTPSLPNGTYVTEVRATDNFGNTTQVYPRRENSVSGSGVTNALPLAALSVSPTLGSTATSFQLSAAGSLDAEDSAALEYRWDYDNDGSYETGYSTSPTTTTSYGAAGAKTAKVEVKDRDGGTSVRTVTFTVSAANVVPTARFTVDKGAVFATSPAVFDFDASGVADGEDATSALEVRWDFDDDGTWDTGYSTTKTASKDYAQDYPINPSFEPATNRTYLYSGNVVNGFAQSFVAATNGIGKASLIINHYNDNTAGGTCTIGLRSSLTGAFLTSLTRNQSAIVDGDWNTFDFPDVAVTLGGTYYLVMICSDGDMMWLSRTSGSTDYPNGAHHYSTNGGVNWTGALNYDHLFRIYDSATSSIPLTKSLARRVRLEVKDSNGQTSQAIRDVWTNAYDTVPTVSLGSSATSGTTATVYNLTATGADADSATTWDGLVHYRWDVNGDGNFETEFASTNTFAASYTQAGTYQATVEVRDRYHATARATIGITVAPTSGASQLAISAGDGQMATVSTAVATAPAVLVRDVSSNPVANAVVVFAVATGGGSVTNATRITNGSGIATLGSWTLGPSAGANSLTATLPAVPGTLVTFNATGSVVLPTLSIGDLTIRERHSGSSTASFPVTLSASSGSTVTVNYTTTPITADANVDYATTTSSVSFNPGETLKSADVLVYGDTSLEPSQTFQVTLSGPSNATILDGTAIGTIADDDSKPTDLDGDARGDLLWRHPGSGDLELFSFDGSSWTRGAYGTQPTDWRMVGQGDFDGDWTADSVWRHSGGNLALTLTGGATSGIGSVPDAAWRNEGVGDLDGDGKADLVWRYRETGDVYAWLMDGASVLSQTWVGTVADAGWQIRAVADLNGDGKADVLWRHETTGQVFVWLMNGTSIASSGLTTPVPEAPNYWQIASVTDMNGDGRADVVWRGNAIGNLYVWFMDGLAQLSEGEVVNWPPESWDLLQVEDSDGDGKGDVAWHDQGTGDVLVWKMDGLTVMGQWNLGNDADLRWDVSNRKPLGDGKGDLVWWYSGSGHVYQWLLNGNYSKAETGFNQVPDTNWQIEGIGDVNGDGRDDLVWRHQTLGVVFGWVTDGLSVRARGGLGQISDVTWRIVGMGDVDGDGRDDLIWRNDTLTDVYAWQTNGLDTPGSVNLGSRDHSWVLVGSGDVDADGKDDLVWYQSSTGSLEAWLMDGASHTTWAIGTQATPWAPIGVAEVSGDGKSDVVWRNGSSGDVEFWLVGSGSYTTGTLALADLDWSLKAVGDANGDGKQDLVWRHGTSGVINVWLLDGATKLGEGQLGPAVTDTNWKIVGTVR